MGVHTASFGISRAPSMQKRKEELLETVRALNHQYARYEFPDHWQPAPILPHLSFRRSWVQQQDSDRPIDLWIEGAEDYIKHAKTVVEDFKDVLRAAENCTADTGRLQGGPRRSCY